MPGDNGILAALDLDRTFLAEEHRSLRDLLRLVVARDVVPAAPEWERQRRVPPGAFTRLGDLGLLGLSFPTRLGGGEAGVRGAVVFHEELARSTFGGVASSVGTHTDFSALHLARAGSAAQVDRWLPAILAGRTVAALAVTEPEASSDLTRLGLRARRDGDAYVLNGTKTFITNANLADLFFVVARTGDTGRHGLSLFAVERSAPGLANGRTFDKSGWHCADTGELVLTDCRIPVAHRIGPEGAGFGLLMRGLDHERLCLAAQAVGLAEAALDATVGWARTRPAYGGVLWDKQAVRHRIADLVGRLAAGKTLLYHAAAQLDRGADGRVFAALLKAQLPELANEIAYAAVQFHGGAGFVREGPVERISRDARFLAIGGGATEVMRDEVARLI
ncbi:acyl-CoA dehydrogenase family protein [Micromonospora sp. NPDC003816]|uniref:acyl-CoA dehydrogenase family protein n=1 Tax=Micromonospora sp. NPDC003816 TaxID=3364224 RepID=UPI00368F2B60